MRTLLLVPIGAWLGCTDPAPRLDSTSTASAGPAPSTQASSSVPAFDQDLYCSRVCKRASDCGVEKAAALTIDGRADEQAALGRATKDRQGVERKCVEGCTKTRVSADQERVARAADACVAEVSCTAFHACLMGTSPH